MLLDLLWLKVNKTFNATAGFRTAQLSHENQYCARSRKERSNEPLVYEVVESAEGVHSGHLSQTTSPMTIPFRHNPVAHRTSALSFAAQFDVAQHHESEQCSP